MGVAEGEETGVGVGKAAGVAVGRKVRKREQV